MMTIPTTGLHFGRASVTVNDSIVTERVKLGVPESEAKQYKQAIEDELLQYDDIFEQMPDCMSLSFRTWNAEEALQSYARFSEVAQAKLDEGQANPLAFLEDRFNASAEIEDSMGTGNGNGLNPDRYPYSSSPVAFENIADYVKDAVKCAIDLALSVGFKYQDMIDKDTL